MWGCGDGITVGGMKRANFHIVRDNQWSQNGPRKAITSKQTWEPENIWLSNHLRNSNFTVARNQPTSYRGPIPVISLFRNYARRRDRIPGYEEARWRFRSVASVATTLKPERRRGKKSRQLFPVARCDVTLRKSGFAGEGSRSRNGISQFLCFLSGWHWTYNLDRLSGKIIWQEGGMIDPETWLLDEIFRFRVL